MHVKLLKGIHKGKVVKVNNSTANEMIRRGEASEVEAPAKAETSEKSEVKK